MKPRKINSNLQRIDLAWERSFLKRFDKAWKAGGFRTRTDALAAAARLFIRNYEWMEPKNDTRSQ